MDLLEFVRWLHLVAASTWVGGMIALGVVVASLRRAGADRAHLQAAARGFAWASWTAMALAIATGVAQVHLLYLPWSHPPLELKLAVVAATVVVALAHQRFARRLSPAARGASELLLLVLALAIVAAAVRLG